VECAGHWPIRIRWERRLWENFRTWEKDFIDVYANSISPGDVVMDIGVEYGEWSVLAATRAGADHVHLFEPNRAIWKHIREIWQYNKLGVPGGAWNGFVGKMCDEHIEGAVRLNDWPPIETGPVQFESLHRKGVIPTISIDRYVELSGCKPSIIKMDIEGAEVLALKGATDTLKKFMPVVFLSVHPSALGAFGGTSVEIHGMFNDLGYRRKLISVDHEEHWAMWAEGTPEPKGFAEPINQREVQRTSLSGAIV
jgi:FkbM family methyltransferase